MTQDTRRYATNDRPRAIPRGCLLSLGSALMTCLMLFINGSLVLAFLAVFDRRGPAWTRDPSFSQFMLFLAPVLLAILQWMMIDYVRSRFQHDHDA